MKSLLAGLAILGFVALAPGASASLTLVHGNSSFVVDESYTPGQWTVDGVSQLYQQGFWWGDALQEYRLGDYFTVQTPYSANSAKFAYQTPNFYAEVTYTLYGGSAGSGMSDVAESIFIMNNSGRAIDLRFFQYSDFDLGGTPGDDTVRFPNSNVVRQSDGSGTMLSETAVTPGADRWEGAYFASTIGLLDDNLYYDLSNTPGVGVPLTGDVTWSFQWDRRLGNGDTFIFSKNKRLEPVPEPTTLLLLGLGFVGVTGVASLRKRRG